MKILITGSSGFIGFHLSNLLLSKDFQVVGIDNMNDYYDVQLKKSRLSILEKKENFSFHQIDLVDRDKINELFEKEKFDYVINLAAQAGVRYSIENPHAYIQSNVVGFMNILEACRNYDVKNLSYASSSSVYGLNKSQPFKTSDHTDHPVSLYAATKNFMDMQDGDVVSTYADVSDLINDFGYKPDTSLEVGIERFVKWYKEFYTDKNKI